MAEELLRGVLRSGDVSGRARGRWSVLPLSIAAHGIVLGAIFIIPLVAEVEPPPVATRIAVFASVMPAMVPEVPRPIEHRPGPAVDTGRLAAPSEAPSAIIPDDLPAIVAPDSPGAIPGVPGGDPLGVPLGLPSGSMAGSPVRPPPPEKPPIVRVGQGIREPRKIVHVAPQYPLIAQRAQVEGVVVLEAVLDETGRVDRMRVLRSEPLLDEAAVQAVRQWRYTPTLLNGIPVPVLMTITVKFSLHR